MKIHKEGYKILLIQLIVLLSVSAICIIFCPSQIISIIIILIFLLLFIFCLRFFRVPHRGVQPEAGAVLSPADGKVVAIEEVDEQTFLKCRCQQISIFMSIWDVHINWYPVGGVVRDRCYHPGHYLVAWHPKSSTQNERTSVVVERPDGVKILVRQIAGYLARRIACNAQTDVVVNQADELGFIRFGSRVDVFLPLDAKICVAMGQKVRGTLTKIAELGVKNEK